MSHFVPGRMLAFGRSYVSNIAWKGNNPPNDASWTGWLFKAGTWVYEPVAIFRNNHEFSLFVVDSNTHSLQQSNYGVGDATGTPMKDLGGKINGIPAVANSKGVIHIFHIGTDHGLHHKYWDGSTYFPGENTYTKVNEKGIYLPGEVAAVSIGEEEVSVFVIGLIDSVLYHIHWTAKNGWGASERMPGQWSGCLSAVSDKPGCWDLFGLNINSGINHLSLKNGKLNELHDMGEGVFTVDAISSAADTLELFTIGLNGSVHHGTLKNGKWQGWLDLRFQAAHRPTPVSHSPGALSVICVGKDSVVYIRSKNATRHNWTGVGWTAIEGAIPTRMAVI